MVQQPRLQEFGRTLRGLRKQRGLTQEDLAYAARDHGSRLTAGAIGQFERGETRPLPETIVAVATALDVSPDIFLEYRLALARGLLDEREVGLEKAARNLERFDGME